MIKNMYTCALQVLYAVAIMVWQNYQDNLAAFTAHKAKYAKQFGDDALAAAIAAKDMPDDQARSAENKTAPPFYLLLLNGILQHKCATQRKFNSVA